VGKVRVQGLPSSRRKIIVRMCETITDLQILGCELHKNALRPGSAQTRCGSYSAPRPPSRDKGEGRKGMGRKGGLGIVGRGRKEREGKDVKGVRKKGKGEGLEGGRRISGGGSGREEGRERGGRARLGYFQKPTSY